MFTDTDYFCYLLSVDDLDNPLSKDKEVFYFSNYPENHDNFSIENKMVPVKLKDEVPNMNIVKFVRWRSKMYSILLENEYSKSATKGVSRILSEQGFWINGSREGKYLTFWEDGVISSDQNYQYDKLQGESLSYWQDGSLYMKSVYDNGVELSHIWCHTDSTLAEDVSLIDNLKRSLEKYIIQGYIDNSDSGLNWVKIVDDEILINCHCLPNEYGDLDDPITGKECSHGTNPWSENGSYASAFYPEVPVLVGDVNKDGVDDYIINYTIEGMGGGTMWINNNILIIFLTSA